MRKIGIWNVIPDQNILTLLARNFDFVIIDLEHGYRSYEDIDNAVRMLNSETVNYAVRVRNFEDPLVQTLLDLGVTNFMLPQARSIRDVEDFRKRLLYSPKGVRGMHPRVELRRTKTGPPASVSSQNNLIKISVIVETKEILEYLEELAMMDNVDDIYLGVYDLSMELGLDANIAAAALDPIYMEIAEITSKHNVSFTAILPQGANLEFLESRGVTRVVAGIDLNLLDALVHEKLTEIKDEQ
jgi:4-hydroxy-2-oxoheptanedioate aldolase